MKQTINLITKLLIGSSLMTSFVFVSFSNASLGSFLNDTYNRLNNGDPYEEFNKTVSLGNLFDHAYNSAVDIEFASEHETFKYMLEDLKSTGILACSEITKDDLMNVYANMYNGELLGKFVNFVNKSKNSKPNNSANGASDKNKITEEENAAKDFVKSCLKVASCFSDGYGANNKEDYKSENLIYDATSFNKCKDTISFYKDYIGANIVKSNNLDNLNLGAGTFFNGDTKDSPYDLMYDMELIGKAFFAESKEATNLNASGGSGGGGEIDLFDELFNSKDDDENGISPEVFGFENPSNPNNRFTGVRGIGIDNEIAKIVGNYNQDKAEFNGSVEGNYCLNPDGTVTYTTPNGDIPESNPYFADLNLNGQSYVNNYYISQNGLSQKDIDDGAKSLADSLFGSPFEEDAQNEINSCNAQCEDMGTFDKMYCQAQCMCQVSSGLDDIVSVKICLVPSKKKGGITGFKSIYSVEEVIDESLNALVMAKESGELIPHKYTDEWFESALQDIELSKLLSFDMVVSYKPLFGDTDELKQQKEDQRASVEKNKEALAELSLLQSIDLQEERNKYSLWYDHDIETAKLKPKIDANDYNQNLIDEQIRVAQEKPVGSSGPELVQKEKAKLNSAAINTVRSFYKDNNKFWDNFNDLMIKLNANARAFKSKIESTAN